MQPFFRLVRLNIGLTFEQMEELLVLKYFVPSRLVFEYLFLYKSAFKAVCFQFGSKGYHEMTIGQGTTNIHISNNRKTKRLSIIATYYTTFNIVYKNHMA